MEAKSEELPSSTVLTKLQRKHGPEKMIEAWLVRSMMMAEEAIVEQTRLELHDGVAQTLARAFQCLQSIEAAPDTGIQEILPTIAKASTLIRDATREIRELIYSLRPASLDQVGLIRTLESELQDLERDGLAIEFHADADASTLPREVETALYRIAHEALNNVMKHAMAHHVIVRVIANKDRVSMVIQDDGVGFNPAMAFGPRRRQYNGIGLLSMRTRAELLRGTLSLTSTPTVGTTVRVDVPTMGPER